MRTGSTVRIAGAGVLLHGGTAWAEDCGPLKQVNAVDLVAGPNRALVPVSINGIPKLFLLDTGGDVTQISGEVAEELKLTNKTSNLKMLDMYGHASNKDGADRQIHPRAAAWRRMSIWRSSPIRISATARAMSGIFGPDMMGRYDVDIDFGTYKMNYFSPDHCPGHVVYWPHAALAYTPMTFPQPAHPLAGQDRRQGTEGGNRYRRDQHHHDGGSGQAPVRYRSGNARQCARSTLSGMAAAFGRVFSTLDFEGVAVNNPHIVIVPDLMGSKDPNNGFQTGIARQKGR